MSLLFPGGMTDFSAFNSDFFTNPARMGWQDIGDAFEMTLQQHGIGVQDVCVQVKNNMLKVQGMKHVYNPMIQTMQSFSQEITLPDGCDTHSIKVSNNEKGELVVTIGKLQNVKRRKIHVRDA